MAQPMGMLASDVVFGEATDEQRLLAWKLSTQGWDAPRSAEDHIEREEHLAQLELNGDGRTRHWVLALKGYPRLVIACCQSTRRPALISDGSGRPARQGHAYSISHVYTSSPYRRQGMAAYLLRRLQAQMDLDSDCSVLYSTSGPQYYNSMGWSPIRSHQATLMVIPEPPPGAPPPPSPTRAVPIQESELPDLCQEDQLRLTKTFNCFPADGKTRFAFLPTYPEISWHLARVEFDARKRQAAANGANGTDTTNSANGANGTNGAHEANTSNGVPATNNTNGASSANGTAHTNGTGNTNGTNGTADTSDTDGTSEDTNATNGTNGANGTKKTTTTTTTITTTTTLPHPTPGAITLNRRTWIYWAHDWLDKRLRILRIPRACDDESQDGRAGLVTPRGQDVGDVAALLEAAVAEAARCGLRKVVVWNPDDAVRAACKAVGNAHPETVKVMFEGCVDGGIPSWRWRGAARTGNAVVWEENYAHCWC